MSRPTPRQAMPPLEFETVQGTAWRLYASGAERFTLLVVYRGLHCPVCKGYLKELAGLLPEFSARGIAVVAVSTDGREQAEAAREQWGLRELCVGYGLTIAAARTLDLYISAGRGETSLGVQEPELFAESGLFFLRPDGTLYAATTSTTPIVRPNFREILSALDFIIKNDYPARGDA
jgi:alkyl hydroperoxide reductase subunit AhpC